MKSNASLNDVKDLTCDEPETPLERLCFWFCVTVVVGSIAGLSYWKWFA